MCTCTRYRICGTHQKQAETIRENLLWLRDMLTALADEA